MKTHLTEEQLLQRQFGLAGVQAVQTMDQHLAECADCRRRQAGLQQKFSALDLLKDDVPAPDALVAGVLDRVQIPSKTVWFRFPKLAAAAAILLVGFVASRYLTGPERDEGMVPEPMALQEESLPRDAAITAAEDLLAEADFAAYAPAPAAASADPAALDRELVAALRAEDPFIPGSNIELNVLPSRDNVQLTIYNAADLTLVRERRVLTMKKGWNWLQFMWANTLIDPTSLQLEAVEPSHRGKVEVEALVFPPRLTELGRWLLFSEISGAVPVEITYFTSGISWRAFYVGTLAPDEQTMRLEAYVRADNHSGEDYENAQTRLLVGKVNQLDRIADLARRQHAYGRPDAPDDGVRFRGLYGSREPDEPVAMYMVMEDSSALGADMELRQKEITKEGLSEYFLYTIEGRETIKHGWGKRLPSFAVEDIPVQSLYKYNEDLWGDQTIRFVSFANDEDHELGDTPLPDGDVRIFRRLDADAHLNYVGEAAISYIPVDEQIELQLGAAREVQVLPRRMEVRTENHLFDSDGNLDGYDEVQVWCLKVSNTREIPVNVEITRNFNATHWDLTTPESGYEKHDLMHGRFRLDLEPRTTRELWYTLRMYHGRRAE